MKRTVVLLSIMGLLVMGLAGTALAVVTDTPHNITNARGVCNNCHVPHLAGGARLWPQSEAASPIRGIVGPLCYSCHDGTIATSTNITLTAWAINATPTTAAGGSHGLNRTSTGAAVTYTMPNTTVTSALPYGDGTATKVFECTTCHDPHNDGAAAPWRQTLLRTPIEGLCQQCHTARGSSTAAWAGYGLGNTLGTHPVGTNVTGDSDTPANSPIDIGVGIAAGGSDLDQPYTAGTPARHQLGGHLNGGTTTGGVVCTTCHAPHGSVDTPTAGYVVGEDLLAIPQDNMAVAVAISGEGYSANGGAGTSVNDPLCEGCHGLAASTWNPGNTSFSHPADAQDGAQTANIAAIPAGWPYSSHNNLSGTANPNCESCHKAHAATVNSHILRAPEATICEQCHTTALALTGHHPVGAGLMTASGMADTTIGNNDGDLTCSDCHNGAGAHNWPAAGMPGLDNDWLPPQNGRTNAAYVIPASGNLTSALVIADTSRTCFNCHTNGNTRQAPTRYTVNDNATAYGEYQDMGDGTHFLGTFTITWANGELPVGTAFNATLGRWPWPAILGAQPAGWVGGFSRFGGTTAAPELVCESCHSLRPTWNDQYAIANRSTTSMLLWDSVENRDELQSQFCQACHGHDPGVATPHPMSGDNVTKAWDAGRTPNTLLTFGQTGTGPNSTTIASYMNANALNNTWIPTTINRTNCNSCHQPHDANTRHGTWILELNADETPTGTLPARTGSLYGAAYNYDGNTTPVSFTPLCLDCHTY